MSVFPAWLRLSKRSNVYKSVFNTPEGQVVLSDLKEFCRLNKSTLVVNPLTRTTDIHATMLAEGRREVLLRIMALCNLGYDDIMRMKHQAEIEGSEDDHV